MALNNMTKATHKEKNKKKKEFILKILCVKNGREDAQQHR